MLEPVVINYSVNIINGGEVGLSRSAMLKPIYITGSGASSNFLCWPIRLPVNKTMGNIVF